MKQIRIPTNSSTGAVLDVNVWPTHPRMEDGQIELYTTRGRSVVMGRKEWIKLNEQVVAALEIPPVNFNFGELELKFFAIVAQYVKSISEQQDELTASLEKQLTSMGADCAQLRRMFCE